MYPSFSVEQLQTICQKHTETIVRESNSGALLFAAYGARLLGLYPEKNGENLLWTYRNLEESFQSGQWMVGGERLWIAPERAFYYENPRDFEGFHVPASIDPGDYSRSDDLVFTNEFPALNYLTNETYDGSTARRSFRLIDDPYQTGLAFAGVAIDDAVALSAPDIPMCAWSLAQVYTCGPDRPATALFPIKPGAGLLSYFNPIPGARADVQNGYARFLIDANEVYKLAIRPEDMRFDNPCKALYLRPAQTGDRWSCLIKRTDDMPRSQQECVDSARENPEGPMGAIQSYNNGPGFSAGDDMPFGEVELQLSTGVTRDGKTVSQASHELLGYTGSFEEILALAQTALAIDNPPALY
jgi:hypothetical protein